MPETVLYHGCRILVGTSGFSYPEWVDSGFYPPGTSSADMLSLYSQHFPLVELNYTWYQMARPEIMERMLARVPENFRFTAKLTRTLTHDIAPDWPAQATAYVRGIEPLLRTGQLLAILIQLPPSFHRTTANRRYLAELAQALHPLPLAVEFRHRSWAVPSVIKGLRQRNIALVCVDAPFLPSLFPPLAEATHQDFFYIRLHGRNREGWFSGTMQQQFNYSYSDGELRQWIDDPCRLDSLARTCRTGIIVFNNHVAGQAVDNARRMTVLLRAASGSTDAPKGGSVLRVNVENEQIDIHPIGVTRKKGK